MLRLSVSRRCLPLLLVVSLGCKGGDDEETTADTASTPATGTATDSGTGGTGSETAALTSTPTTSLTEVMTSTEDPSAGTGSASGSTGGDTDSSTAGAEPVPCDSPEGCTAMGEGDLEAFPLPFFRGTVCVSDAVKPGDTLALAVTTCAHPCLAVTGFKFKWKYRCDGGQGCEVALVYFHPDTTGAACPSDVFGEFDPALCADYGPTTISLTPPMTDGAASLLLPFLTNADVAAIAGGQDDAPAVWGFVDGHTQAPGRRLALDFSADNDAAPATCGEGVPGCTCTKIGLP